MTTTSTNKAIAVTPEIAEALRHVAAAWTEQPSQRAGVEPPDMVRFEFMNVPEVAPLMRLFNKFHSPSVDYYDIHAAEFTRFRWTLPRPAFRRLFVAWRKHEGDLALPLTMRLPKKGKKS